MPKEATYQRTANALGSSLGDEMVVLNFDDGVYYSVQGVGVALWSRLEDPATEAELVDIVVAGFDVDAGRARRDIRAFLKQMIDASLVRLV